jgi:hypothetical protein
MDFLKYKDRLEEYVKRCGYEVSEKGNTRCFLSTHPTDDKKPSMKFYGDRFKCFGCDQSGDIFDMAGLINGTTDKAEQYKIVESTFGDTFIPPSNKDKPQKKKPEIDTKAAEIITNYMREQAELHQDKLLEFAKFRKYSARFASVFGYWPGNNQAIKDVGQETLTGAGIPDKTWKFPGVIVKYSIGYKLMFAKNNETLKFASSIISSFPFPKLPDCDSIILVEAEISAIAGNMNGIRMISTGGTSVLNNEGCKLLHKYKEVIFCFDADDAGQKANLEKASLLLKSGYEGLVKIAKLKVQEFGNDPDDYIKSGHIEELKKYIENAVSFHLKDKKLKEIPKQESKGNEPVCPFRFLGFTEHNHYFLDRKNMITKVAAGKMTSGQLLEIAPLGFWESIKSNEYGNPKWTFIFDMLIDKSKRTGPYIDSSIRGVGVWQEPNEIIVSDGEYIICNAGKILIKDYDSKNTYIRRAPKGLESKLNKQADKDFIFINKLIEDLSFSSDQDGQILFGWIISSIFLSTIRWRPIVYMKGPSGVGKSWVMNNIVRNILDGLAISPKKNSTAIGVMQAPGYDSRMTTVDELETSHDKKTQDLVVGLMNLARENTTQSKETRYVGTADQEGISSDFRSMFLFASIVESSEQDQDVNRITSVNFYPKRQKNWSEIEAEILFEFNNGIGDRIRYNAIYHRESIVKNIYLFQKIAGAKSTRQRNGDQMGTLIAGWYHLEYPGKIVTCKEAQKYIGNFDFTEQEERNKGESLKHILSSILSHKIRYEEENLKTDMYGNVTENIKTRERPIFDILRDIKDSDSEDVKDKLNSVLMAYGIRYGTFKNPTLIGIAQGHEEIRKMFPYGFSHKVNYHGYLQNHPDYKGKENSGRFKGTVHQVLLFDIDLDEEEIPF